MKLTNESMLADLRKPGLCQWCGKPCPDGRDPAHILSRGAGRVDIETNLAALCRACHQSSHAGQSPTPDELVDIKAKMNGLTAEEIRKLVWKIRADPRKVLVLK